MATMVEQERSTEHTHAVPEMGSAGERGGSSAAARPARRSRSGALVIGAAAVALVLITAGFRSWWFGRSHVSTDDAQVDGHVIPVSPKIGGFSSTIIHYFTALNSLMSRDCTTFQTAHSGRTRSRYPDRCTLHGAAQIRLNEVTNGRDAKGNR